METTGEARGEFLRRAGTQVRVKRGKSLASAHKGVEPIVGDAEVTTDSEIDAGVKKLAQMCCLWVEKRISATWNMSEAQESLLLTQRCSCMPE